MERHIIDPNLVSQAIEKTALLFLEAAPDFSVETASNLRMVSRAKRPLAPFSNPSGKTEYSVPAASLKFPLLSDALDVMDKCEGCFEQWAGNGKESQSRLQS